MNVKEINPGSLGTLSHYFAMIIPLTAVIFWIVAAVQIKYLSEKPEDVSVWSQLWWPLTSAHQLLRRPKEEQYSHLHHFTPVSSLDDQALVDDAYIVNVSR